MRARCALTRARTAALRPVNKRTFPVLPLIAQSAVPPVPVLRLAQFAPPAMQQLAQIGACCGDGTEQQDVVKHLLALGLLFLGAAGAGDKHLALCMGKKRDRGGDDDEEAAPPIAKRAAPSYTAVSPSTGSSSSSSTSSSSSSSSSSGSFSSASSTSSASSSSSSSSTTTPQATSSSSSSTTASASKASDKICHMTVNLARTKTRMDKVTLGVGGLAAPGYKGGGIPTSVKLTDEQMNKELLAFKTMRDAAVAFRVSKNIYPAKGRPEVQGGAESQQLGSMSPSTLLDDSWEYTQDPNSDNVYTPKAETLRQASHNAMAAFTKQIRDVLIDGGLYSPTTMTPDEVRSAFKHENTGKNGGFGYRQTVVARAGYNDASTQTRSHQGPHQDHTRKLTAVA